MEPLVGIREVSLRPSLRWEGKYRARKLLGRGNPSRRFDAIVMAKMGGKTGAFLYDGWMDGWMVKIDFPSSIPRVFISSCVF